MKYFLAILILILSFALGYSYRDANVSKTLQTITKIDTIKVSYRDTVYRYVAKKKIIYKTDTLVSKDTITFHDTAYIAYSSPFKLGVDTLNCTGIVSFDMTRFSFSGVKFQYPQRTITKIQIKKKIDWLYVALAFIGGAVAESQIK